MEKIISDQLGNIIFSGLLFFIQLYFRSVLSEIKKEISELKDENKEDRDECKKIIVDMYDKVNRNNDRLTAIEVTCRERHRGER
jgi:hypothetical protein